MTEEEKEERIQELTEMINGKDCELTALRREVRDACERRRKALETTVGCLRAVKAMLQHSMYGATHRQRNFYGEATVKFIDNSLADIEAEENALPF